jgi:hypothetical protein
VLYRFQKLPILWYIATSQRSVDANLLALHLAAVRPEKQLAQMGRKRSEGENASKWNKQEIVTIYTLVNRESLSTK